MDLRTCPKCEETKPSSEFRTKEKKCKTCIANINNEWVKNNRDKINEAAARRRYEALCYYSRSDPPKCGCCGIKCLAFLTFEHTEGGGGQHRRETGGGGFLSWLRKNNYPPGFEVLCYNCNMGRRINGGVCPHDEFWGN